MKYDVNKYTKESIGKRIREYRNKRGMSLSETSALCYMTEPGLWRLENGLTFPSIITIVKLAEVLGISTDMIIFGEEPLTCAIYMQMKDDEQLKIFRESFNEFFNGGKNKNE